MTTRLDFRFVASAFLLCLLAGTGSRLSAQNLGFISGVVTDKSNLAVPNADVKLTNRDTGLVRTFVTNESGNYTAPSVQMGTYTLEITAPGFSVFRQTGIEVSVRDVLRIDAQLSVSSISETVEVKAEAVQ